MDDDNRWRQFDKVKVDRRQLRRHVKKASTATTRHAHKFLIKRLDRVRESRREIIGWLLLMGLLIAAVWLQLFFFRQNYSSYAPDTEGVYVEGALGPIDSLNPLYAKTSAEASLSKLLFSSLYTYDESGTLHGDLAETYTTDETGKVYNVTLREGVKWHDSKPLTAKDVEFTINLIKNPDARTPLRINWNDVSVKAIGERIVQFTLPGPYAAFPHALTFPVLPQHLLARVAPNALRENTYSQSPVGSGPFKFRLVQLANSMRNHKIIRMIANQDYYRGSPKLSRFDLHAYSSSDELLKSLKGNEVSGAADISLGNVSKVPDSYQLIAKPVASGEYLILNMKNPVLQDVKVRKALQIGTNTADVRSKFDVALPSLDLPFVNNQLAGKDVPKAPAFDALRAGALLDEAGWTLNNGMRAKDGQPLRLTITTIKDPQYTTVISALKEQWGRLGIDVQSTVIDVSSPTTSFIQNVLQPRNFDILLYRLNIGADPDVYAYWHSTQTSQSGYNFSGYASMEADANLTSARSRVSPELRNAKYIAFAQQWLADVPAIGLYQQVMVYAGNANSTTITAAMNLVAPTNRYENLIYWSTGEKPVYQTP